MVKIRVYRVTEATGGASYIEENIGNILDELRDSSVGSEYKVTVEEMTREDYDALPEFEGF